MIQMIVVGALKESYLREGQQYFLDEISKREDVELIELEDEKIPETASEKELTMIRQIEGQKILSKVNRLNTMIAMDIDGKSMTKDRWSNLFKQHRTQKKGMTFIIGGSVGLSDEVKQRANFRVSFSRLTFPHQLFRLMLLEQIADAIL